MKSPKPYLQHILESIRENQDLLEGYSFEMFAGDRRTELAVIKLLEIIRESCSQLESRFIEEYPEIPWKKIISMRNRLVHEYWGVDQRAVWKVVQQNLQELYDLLFPVVENFEKEV
jgi:uncharacterized protein with HEPN domain